MKSIYLFVLFIFMSSTANVFSNWEKANTGMKTGYYQIFGSLNDTIYASEDNKVVFSIDSCKTWIKAEGWPEEGNVKFMFKDSNRIYIGVYGGGLYLSTDNAKTWKRKSNGIRSKYVSCLNRIANTLIVGTIDHGIFTSTNNGDTWEDIENETLYTAPVNCITIYNNTVYIGTNQKGLYKSNDTCRTWDKEYKCGDFYSENIIDMLISDKNIIYLLEYKVFYSDLMFDNLTEVKNHFGYQKSLTNLIKVKDTLFIGVSERWYKNAKVLISIDDGVTWIDKSDSIFSRDICSLFNLGNKIFVSSVGAGVYMSEISPIRWQNYPKGSFPANVNCLLTVGTDLYAATANYGIYVSTNFGENWSSINKGLTTYSIKCLAKHNNVLYAGTEYGGVFTSTDFGKNWVSLHDTLRKLNVSSFAFVGQNIYIGSQGYGVYRSTDNGLSWRKFNVGEKNEYGGYNNSVTSLATINDTIYAGTWGDGVYMCTNNDTIWKRIEIWTNVNSFQLINCLYAYNDTLCIGTQSGMFTFNTTNHLFSHFFDGEYVDNIEVYNNIYFLSMFFDIFAFISDNSLYKDLDEQNEISITNQNLKIIWPYIFVCSPSGIYRLNLSDNGILDVNDNGKLLSKFKLYPNISHDQITISIAESPDFKNSEESVKIYNAIGELLYESNMNTINEKKIDISSFPKGIYFLNFLNQTRSFIKN